MLEVDHHFIDLVSLVYGNVRVVTFFVHWHCHMRIEIDHLCILYHDAIIWGPSHL
jgi:hypothetical protein